MTRGGIRKGAGRRPTGNDWGSLSCTATATERAQVEALAEAANLSVSQWVKQAIKDKAQRQIMGVM